MGMPITTYSVLQLLANRPAASDEADQRLYRVLAQFRLFAVVLHDPSRHAPLHKFLLSKFEDLDSITGSKLLFFSAIEANPKWRERAEKRSYFKLVEERLQIKYAYTMDTPTLDPELTLVGAALALGIPVTELPCLVVFGGESSEFVWFRTGVGTIRNQLERLALAAYKIEETGGPSSPGGLQRLLSHFRIEHHFSSVDDGSSVAGLLAALLAFSVVDQHYRDAARNDVLGAIELRRREFVRILGGSRQDEDNFILNVTQSAIRYAIAFVLSRGVTEQLNWSWPSRELWEIEAAASLSAAMKLQTLNDPELAAPIVLCYGRSFEAEINASIVQGLRQQSGISMPLYYGKHQPGTTACVEVNIGGTPRSIDLNARRDGRWQPPGLGDSERAATALGEKGLLESEPWAVLLKQWRIIRQHRNSAAHPRADMLYQSSIKGCHGAFECLQDAGVLKGIFDLKRALRNPGDEHS